MSSLNGDTLLQQPDDELPDEGPTTPRYNGFADRTVSLTYLRRARAAAQRLHQQAPKLKLNAIICCTL